MMQSKSLAIWVLVITYGLSTSQFVGVSALVSSNRAHSMQKNSRAADQPPPVIHHKRLVKDLIENRGYDPRVRPVSHHHIPVNVTIRMNLYQIVDVNERHQHIVLYVWMTQTWMDEFLNWNPDEYDKIDSIVVPFQNVWLPDTYLYNG